MLARELDKLGRSVKVSMWKGRHPRGRLVAVRCSPGAVRRGRGLERRNAEVRQQPPPA